MTFSKLDDSLPLVFYMIEGNKKIVFSADNYDENLIFQSLKQVEVNLKPWFWIKSSCYIVPSPSTTLVFTSFNPLSLQCYVSLTDI